MKNKIFIGAIVFCCLAYTSFVNRGSAQVTSFKGLYLFIESQPTEKFERIGSVKFSKFWATDNSFVNMRGRFVEKCKEKYPNADGMILYLSDDDKDYTADVIKFE